MKLKKKKAAMKKKAARKKAAKLRQAATARKIVTAAKKGIGRPYAWGGTSPSRWDCSGFVKWAHAKAGVKLPRTKQ